MNIMVKQHLFGNPSFFLKSKALTWLVEIEMYSTNKNELLYGLLFQIKLYPRFHTR